LDLGTLFEELILPLVEDEFYGERTSLSEPKPVDTVDGPGAIMDEVVNDPREVFECGCWIGPVDEFAQGVERGIPLVGFFVEKRNSFQS
jgi:hypothetical protein